MVFRSFRKGGFRPYTLKILVLDPSPKKASRPSPTTTGIIALDFDPPPGGVVGGGVVVGGRGGGTVGFSFHGGIPGGVPEMIGGIGIVCGGMTMGGPPPGVGIEMGGVVMPGGSPVPGNPGGGSVGGGGVPVGVVGALVPLMAFSHVFGPTIPSATSAFFAWKDLVAAVVWGPKIPSAGIWRKICQVLTSAPVEPCRIVGIVVL